jgi:acetone carboxylase gamma subunit
MSRTEEIVIRERQLCPCATTVQIAFVADVTPERVRQILSAHDLPTRHWKQRDYVCNNCGMIFSIGNGKPRHLHSRV